MQRFLDVRAWGRSLVWPCLCTRSQWLAGILQPNPVLAILPICFQRLNMNRMLRDFSTSIIRVRTILIVGLLGATAALLVSCASEEEIRHSKEKNQPPQTVVYAEPSPSAPTTTYSYPGSVSSPGWPRVSAAGDVTNLLYQPRVDYWDGRKLIARDAVEVKSKDGQSVFGVVTFQATTLVDKNARMVRLVDISVTKGDFPSHQERSAELVQLVRQTFPKE